MQIGLISDVHSNLPALEAVLEDMPTVDDIVCVGDIVGYNAWPRECLECIREVASVIVQGNHDRNVDTPHRYSANRMAEAGLELAQAELDDEQREWLADLSPRSEVAGGDYQLVHSHPDPEHLGRYVYPRDFPRMRPYLDDYSGIILGHTHVQHEATIDGRLIVNPGSVGQPRDQDPRAAYGILNTECNTIEFRRVEYDVARTQRRNEEKGLPQSTGDRLKKGR